MSDARTVLAENASLHAEVERLTECLEAMNDSADILDSKNARLTAQIRAVQRLPLRHEVVPIDEPVRRHAYLKGYETAILEVRSILDAAADGATDE